MTHPGRAPRRFRSLILPMLALAVVHPAAALDLAWPEGAIRVSETTRQTADYPLATGPFRNGAVPVLAVDGDLREEVWQVPATAADPAIMLRRLREQLLAQGYEIVFGCADRDCGGFDFRYALPIAQGPAMHVDLGRFHYLAARREGADHVALTVSQGGTMGYVHLARVLPSGALPVSIVPSTRQADAASDADLIGHLTATGYAVLEDLTFDTGSSALSGTLYDSLVTLAEWLSEAPTRRVVLVGHTDAEGALEGNIALSRARAAAVRDLLIEALGVDPARIEAAGVGYLAPRASNADTTGREANRRVEVVLLSQ